MSRKIAFCLLALALLLTLFPVLTQHAQAEPAPVHSSDKPPTRVIWTYRYNSVTVRFNTGTGDMTISGSGTFNVSSSDSVPWDEERQYLKNVTVEEGISAIGNYFFCGCENLQSIILPSTLTSINKSAFEGCSSLREITLPEGVTTIRANAFQDCSALTEICLPASLTTLEGGAFSGCSNLTSVTVAEGNTAFSVNDDFLLSTDGTVLYLAPCNLAGEYVVPDSIVTLEANCFANSSKLSSIVLHSGVSLKPFATVGALGLENIYVSADHPNYQSLDGVLFSKDGSVLEQYPPARTGSYTVPTGTQNLASYSFSNMTGSLEISLPDTLTEISNYTFYCNTALKAIRFNEGLQRIGNYAFQDCAALRQLPLPASLAELGSGCFKGCGSLTEISIPESISLIPNYAFSDCISLQSITLRPGLTQIGLYAFQNCSSLAQILLPEGLTALGTACFINCSGLETVQLPSSLTELNDVLFSNCSKLVSVSPLNAITKIGTSTFNNCSSLQTLPLPDGLLSIGSNAFKNCALTEAVIPKGITAIPSAAFEDCTALQKLTLPAALQSISSNAFKGCALTELFIPKSVSSIGSGAFSNCSTLKAVHFLGDAPECNSNAFSGCAEGFTVRYLADTANWTATTWNGYSSAVWTCTASTTADCIKDGAERYVCDLCQAACEMECPAYGHSLGDWFLYAKPTQEASGAWHRICSACSFTDVMAIPAQLPAAQESATSTNQGDHEYGTYGYAAVPTRSYLFEAADGSLNRIEALSSELTLETFDSSFRFVSRRTLPMELPLFGGFYEGKDYYFLVYGQTNKEESDDAEVIRVVRYTKDWLRFGHASLYGANTYIPFDAGSLQMIQYGDMLYIHTSHEMYASSDGLHHQANLTLSVHISDMQVTDSRHIVYNISTGYVSHSFNQFIRTDGDILLTLDHGDAYPRSAVICQYSKPAGQPSFYGSVKNSNVITYYGRTGANATGSSLGGFEVTDEAYLTAGNSIVQDGSVSTSGQRNIFLGVTPKGTVGTNSTALRWITSHPTGAGVSVSNPFLLKIDGNKLLLLWTENKSTLRYVFVDALGELLSEIYEAPMLLSDCQPVIYQNKVCWYVTNGTEPAFFAIPLEDPAHPETHNAEVDVTLSAKNTELDGTVLTFHYGKPYGELPVPSTEKSALTFLGWYPSSQGYNYQESSAAPVSADTLVSKLTDHTLYAHWRLTSHTCEYAVAQTIPANCTSGKIEVMECLHCFSSYRRIYSTLAHQWDSGTVTTPATCTAVGIRTYQCKLCDATKTESIRATGHSYVTDPAIAPTCTKTGLTQGKHCSVCNAVLTAQQTVPARGHSLSYAAQEGSHLVSCACGLQYTEAHSYDKDRTCTLCGYYDSPVVSTLILRHSLNLADDISINYVVEAAALDGYDSFYLQCRVANYKGNDLVDYSFIELQPTLQGSLYYFTLEDLCALQMNDAVEATLFLSKNGREYYSKTDCYSIATYAYAQLDRENAADALKTLCADLLRYGAQAQIFKSYRTDTLADTNMTELHRSYLTDLSGIPFGNINRTDADLAAPTISWAGKTLVLDSRVTLRYVFNAAGYQGDISKLTLHIRYTGSDGAETTVTVSDPQPYGSSGALYYFDFYALPAAELRAVVAAAIYAGDSQLSQTLHYSADSYANGKDGLLLEVCKALFAYADSANRFFQ